MILRKKCLSGITLLSLSEKEHNPYASKKMIPSKLRTKKILPWNQTTKYNFRLPS